MQRLVSLIPGWNNVRWMKFMPKSQKAIIFVLCVSIICLIMLHSDVDDTSGFRELSFDFINYTGAHQENELFIKYVDVIMFGKIDETPDYYSTGEFDGEIDIEKLPRYNISKRIAHLLDNKLFGNFIEGYVGNGKEHCICAYFEEELTWDGLLIEKDLKIFLELGDRYKPLTDTIHAELSTDEYVAVGKLENENSAPYTANWTIPLYSLMVAKEYTKTDLLVLNTKGTELKILQTLPWNKIDIRVICIDSAPSFTAGTKIHEYLKTKGYRLEHKDVQAIIFIKKDDFSIEVY